MNYYVMEILRSDFANLIRPGDKVKFSANVVKGKSIGNVNEFEDESLD